MHISSVLPTLLLLLIFPPLNATASPKPSDPPRRVSLTYIPTELSSSSIRLDGVPDEPLWLDAPAMEGFTQSKPDPGRAATQRTRFRILSDGEHLYVAVEAFETSVDSIVAPLFRRDGGEPSDWVYVSVDSYMDRRTGFVFAVNPRGVQKDLKFFDDKMEDPLWDAVWEAASRISETGWTAEFKIPVAQLRFNSVGTEGGREWGLNVAREISRNGELSFWSPTNLERDGIVSQFGILENVDDIRPPGSLELLPYLSQQLTRSPRTGDDPFHAPTDAGTAMGLDLKYTFRNGLTASATVNPDFGQVEADPTQVNLTANQLFFPERRPFFLEGGDIFRFGNTQTFSTPGPPITFYSRRIGRAPSGSPSMAGLDAEYAETPLQTSIFGAAKVSGKIGDGWSVGVLQAFTAREDARLQLSDGDRRSITVEPASQYAVARLKRDFSDGRGYVGGFTSYTSRSMAGTYLADHLPGSAILSGADFEARTPERDWVVSGAFSMSHVSGSRASIERLQRSPVRWYQRPDYRSQSVDPMRTNLTGTAGELSVQKAGGRSWLGSLTYSAVSPGYEANDVGFQNRAGYRALHAVAIYRDLEPERVQSYDVFSFHGRGWNPDGLLTDQVSGLGTTLEFRNQWRFNIEGFHAGASYDDRLTRGGPVARSPRIWIGSMNLWSDRSRNLTSSIHLDRSANEEGEWETELAVETAFRPLTNLLISLRPALRQEFDVDQYLFSTEDELAALTYGRRYVFSDIRQRMFTVSMRVNWTFSPSMTLETYLRPYITSGDFKGYKEFAEPRTFRFNRYRDPASPPDPAGDGSGTIRQDGYRYEIDPDGDGPAAPFGFGDPDFGYASLQGNAVFRWEYRPGSTFYLVWQLQRDEAASTARFDPLRQGADLFRGEATHVWLAKVSFWM